MWWTVFDFNTSYSIPVTFSFTFYAIVSTVKSIADELGFRNPKLAIKLYGNLGDIEIADGKVVDVDKIKEKINTLLTTETYLKKTEDKPITKSPEQIKEAIDIELDDDLMNG